MPAPSITHTTYIDKIAKHATVKWGIAEADILCDKPKEINSSQRNCPKIGRSYPDLFIKTSEMLVIGEAKASKEDYDNSTQFEDYVEYLKTSIFHNEVKKGYIVVCTSSQLKTYIQHDLNKKFPKLTQNIDVISDDEVYEIPSGKISFKTLNPKLLHEAKPFQSIAINKVKDLPYSALFFEQGLGKTKMAIDVMSHWFSTNSVDTVVIFTKKILVDNWIDELEKHSDIDACVIQSGLSTNHYLLNAPKRLYVANFEALQSEYKKFENLTKLRKIGVILDESAKIKNIESSLSKVFMEYSPLTERRMILTGTPVANRPHDIWSQIFFLDGGDSLGTNFKKFKKEVDIPKKYLNDDLIRDYSRILKNIFPKLENFCFRETKISAPIELPDIIYRDITCSWEDNQYEMYSNVKRNIEIPLVRDGVTQYDISDAIAKKLLRLIQVASNPILIDENYKHLNGKYEQLKNILSSIPANEKVIIWTSFVDNVKWIVKKLKMSNIEASFIHGKITITERNRQKEKFIKDNATRILVANPAAAKEGLTLTCANHAIYYDRNFTLDDYLQSVARIHRISQNKTCMVYHLVMENSIDSWVGNYIYLKELAAQLAQGDISESHFEEHAPRNLKEQLLEVLNI